MIIILFVGRYLSGYGKRQRQQQTGGCHCCTMEISFCGQGISCSSFLILDRKKAGDLFQISCLVRRWMDDA